MNDNCNESFKLILSKLTVYERGVMFLDPYALELDWSILEKASFNAIVP